jgi:hypothetical protein
MMKDDERIAVVLALSDAAFYYENDEFSGFLDLEWVDQVDYVDALADGTTIGHDRVLSIRCFGRTFEFILPQASVADWKTFLLKGEQHPRLASNVVPFHAATA